MTEDLAEDFKVNSHKLIVNWSKPAKDVYASEDYYLQPGTRLLTTGELQEVLSRKRKKRTNKLVNACRVDEDQVYAFVPKQGAANSMVANAMTIVRATQKLLES